MEKSFMTITSKNKKLPWGWGLHKAKVGDVIGLKVLEINGKVIELNFIKLSESKK